MRRLLLLIFLTLSALFITPFATAQVAVDMTIYREADSLTLYSPGISIRNIALETTLPNGWKVTQSLLTFPAFRDLRVTGSTCLRFIHEANATDLPTDCQNADIYTQTLADDDPFWEDTAGEFSIVNTLTSENYGICAADSALCTATFTFGLDEAPICNGVADDREMLIVVAQFENLTSSSREPGREWESVLKEAVTQSGLYARVLRLPDIITTPEVALRLSDCYRSPLVIWGKITAENIESNFTRRGFWSFSPTLPFDASPTVTLLQSVNDTESGDDEYLLNFALAEVQYSSGFLEDALPIIERAIEQAPPGREREMGAATMYFYLGYLRAAIQGNGDAAVEAFSEALLIDSEFENAAFIYAYRGVVYQEQGKITLALADYNEAIRLNPQYVYAYYNRGNIYQLGGQFDLAIADFTEAIRINPAYEDAYNNRGLTYLYQGQYDLAIADFDEAIRLDPTYVQAYNNRGLAYYDTLEYDLAIADYSEAVQLDPQNTNLYYSRGLAYHDNGQHDLAIADYTQAIQLDPQSDFIYYSRGQAYRTQEKYDLAIADFSEAIRLDPAYAQAYGHRGLTYVYQGEYDLAIADFDEAIRLDPQYAYAYYNRGNAYSQQGDYRRAIADFDEAIRLDPTYTSAYFNRGYAYLVNQMFEQAIADFDEAIRLDPTNESAYYNRAYAYLSSEMYALAIADYDIVIGRDATRAEAFYFRGIAHQSLGELDLALEDITRSIEMNYALLPRSYMARGSVYLARGELELALADFNEVVTLEPELPDGYAGLGISYDALGRTDEAITAYRRYIELAGNRAAPSLVSRLSELEATPTPTPAPTG